MVNLKDEGAQYFTAVSSFEEVVPLQKEMGAQGYTPTVTELQTNFYNAKYPELAKEQGANIDNTYVRLTTWPFEEADARPAMKKYLEVLEAGVPGAPPEQLGVQAFSAGLLFATAAKAAGPELTRDKLLTELANIHEWDGGGLHGVSDPGEQRLEPVLHHAQGQLRRLHPRVPVAGQGQGRLRGRRRHGLPDRRQRDAHGQLRLRGTGEVVTTELLG